MTAGACPRGDGRYASWFTDYPSTHERAGETVEVVPAFRLAELQTALERFLDTWDESGKRPAMTDPSSDGCDWRAEMERDQRSGSPPPEDPRVERALRQIRNALASYERGVISEVTALPAIVGAADALREAAGLSSPDKPEGRPQLTAEEAAKVIFASEPWLKNLSPLERVHPVLENAMDKLRAIASGAPDGGETALYEQGESLADDDFKPAPDMPEGQRAVLRDVVRAELDLHLRAWETTLGGPRTDEARRYTLVVDIVDRIMGSGR